MFKCPLYKNLVSVKVNEKNHEKNHCDFTPQPSIWRCENSSGQKLSGAPDTSVFVIVDIRHAFTGACA